MLQNLKSIIWSVSAAPYYAGSPPAMVMGIYMYNSTLAAVGNGWWIAAALVGFIGVFGIMRVEMMAYETAAEAFAKGSWGVLVFCALFGVIISGMVAFTVYAGHDTMALVLCSAGMLIGFGVIMAKTFLAKKSEARAAIIGEETTHTQNQVALLEAQTKYENAQKNREKLSIKKASIGVQQVSTARVDSVDTPEAVKVRQAWKDNPGVSQREIARICQVSPMTAGKYKPAEGVK